jgi:hypothetical protein
MNGVKIVDKTIKFINAVESANDIALNRMAADIERLAKQVVPHDQGPLHSSGRHERLARLKYRVIFNKEYAAYQERGMRKDGTHVVKNYSKPGKKSTLFRGFR